jgi:preprotein translocase subunit SecD
MSNLKYRLLLIAALFVASIVALFPTRSRERIIRDGTFVDTMVRRVPLRLGLDLQGGMYLALEIDQSKTAVTDVADAVERALKVVRSRIDELGVSEPNVQKTSNNRIIVELPGIADRERAQAIVEKQAFLEFQITDKTQAFEKVLPRMDALLKQKGVAGTAAKPDSATPKGLSTLLGPGATDSAQKARADSIKKAKGDSSLFADADRDGLLKKRVLPGGMPGEYLVARADYDDVRRYLSYPDVIELMPPGKVLRWGADSIPQGTAWYRTFYVVDKAQIATGADITNAQPNNTPMEGTVVLFTLNNQGGRKFRIETTKHVKDNMAIVLDGRVMGQPPVIQSAIGTNGQITMGGKPFQAAADLALVLRAGSLPVPLKVVDTREIGASLGADSIRQGLHAAILAIALVIVIMVGYYRFAGVLAIGGLVLYVLFTMAALAAMSAVLTLPGLAGFVLSIGIAVDANVLIFERIREELAHGKTVRTSIDEGFRHAMSAIIDSNVATALTAAVLYQYGTGPVRGFAVTLLAGIAASMISSIFVVRTFFIVWLNRSRGAQTLSI